MLIYCTLCTVPSEYYAQLDATGRRIDLNQRPELTKGTVEYVAPIDYMVRPPMPPVYFFLIDVSITAFRSGMIEVSTSLSSSLIFNKFCYVMIDDSIFLSGNCLVHMKFSLCTTEAWKQCIICTPFLNQLMGFSGLI